jgi:chromosome segregation ATPase
MAEIKTVAVDAAIEEAVKDVEATVTRADALRAQLADARAQQDSWAAQVNALRTQIAEAEGPEAKRAEEFATAAERIMAGRRLRFR